MLCSERMLSIEKPGHVRAHTHSSSHREEVLNSRICGCFYCLAVFEPDEIKDWIDIDDENGIGQTALCPKCKIDSVIGSGSGFSISQEFLSKMYAYWFGTLPG